MIKKKRGAAIDLGEDLPKPWPEARILAMPQREGGKPVLLVERNPGELEGPNGEDLVYLEGQPCISLFTGAGGMDIGTEQAGFCGLVQHEWDGSACATLIVNRPTYFRHAALIQGDIRQTPTSMILGAAGLRVGEAALLTGGPPCQGFSTANGRSRSGAYDQRNDLVYEYLRVVREAQPKFFVMENVPGFVDFNKNEYLGTFLRAAYDAYYELVYGLVNAAEYGVPQTRCRFICMGTRRDLHEIEGKLGSLPEPQNFSNGDLKRLKEWRGMPLFHHEDEALLMHAPGVRYFPDRELLIPPTPFRPGREDAGRSFKFQEFYRRLRADEPDRIVNGPRG